MVNPRFLKLVEKWKSKEPPAERPKKTPDKGLVKILEKDEDGKPIIKLEPIKKTAVNTRTQDDYWTLMRVYECGGFKWIGGGLLPTSINTWTAHREKTCIGAGVSVFEETEGKFARERKYYYQNIGWSIISTSEFYKNQKVTKKMIKEINRYFDNKSGDNK